MERYHIEDIEVLRIDRNRTPPRSARDDYDMPALAPLLMQLLQEIRPDVVHVCHIANLTTVLSKVTETLGIPTFTTLTDFFNICLNGMLQTPTGGLCDGPNETRSNCLTCGMSNRGSERSGLFWQTVARPEVRRVLAPTAALLAPLLPPPLGTDARAVVRRPDVMRAAMSRYRAAIAPTQFLRDIFLANGATVPLVLSRFGIDIDRSPKPVRQGGPIRFGFMGQLLWHKGPHLLLQALRRLPEGSFTLDIWGSEQLHAPYSADLRAVAAPMPITFRGTFKEPEMAGLLADIDVLVLPSTWFENGPLTLLKALATHTPVVVSDVPGVTEFIHESVDGFSFPRGDAEALAETLRRFVDDPSLAQRMSLNTAYPRTERDMVLDLIDLYKSTGAVPEHRVVETVGDRNA